jgi:hypothetical protein
VSIHSKEVAAAMDGETDEFLYTLQRVKSQLQQSYSVANDNGNGVGNAHLGLLLDEAKQENHKLIAKLQEKDQLIATLSDRILALESDIKVDCRRVLLEAQVKELNSKIALLNQNSSKEKQEHETRVSKLESELANAKALLLHKKSQPGQDTEITTNTAAAATTAVVTTTEDKATMDRIEALKKMARNFKKKCEDQEAEMLAKDKSLESLNEEVIRLTSLKDEFRLALGEAQRKIKMSEGLDIDNDDEHDNNNGRDEDGVERAKKSEEIAAAGTSLSAASSSSSSAVAVSGKGKGKGKGKHQSITESIEKVALLELNIKTLEETLLEKEKLIKNAESKLQLNMEQVVFLFSFFSFFFSFSFLFFFSALCSFSNFLLFVEVFFPTHILSSSTSCHFTLLPKK